MVKKSKKTNNPKQTDKTSIETSKKKGTKNTDKDIKERRHIIFKMLLGNDIYSQKSVKERLEARGIFVTIPTISRDFNDLKVKKDENGLYKVTGDTLKDYNRYELTHVISHYTYKNFMNNLSFLMVNVKNGYGDFVGMKLTEVFPDEIVGYLTSNNLLMLFFKDEDKYFIVKSFIDEMAQGFYISEDYGMFSESDTH